MLGSKLCAFNQLNEFREIIIPRFLQFSYSSSQPVEVKQWKQKMFSRPNSCILFASSLACIKLVIKIQKWKTLLPPSFCKSHCIPMKIPSPESKTPAVVEVPHKICFVAIYSLYEGGYFGWMNEPKINISLMNRRKRPDNSKKAEQPGQCLIDGCNFLQCFHDVIPLSWDNGYVH